MRLNDTAGSILGRKGNQVWSISPERSVFEAVEKMAEKGVGALAVVVEERLVGIVTLQNLMHSMALLAESRKLRSEAE